MSCIALNAAINIWKQRHKRHQKLMAPDPGSPVVASRWSLPAGAIPSSGRVVMVCVFLAAAVVSLYMMRDKKGGPRAAIVTDKTQSSNAQDIKGAYNQLMDQAKEIQAQKAQ